MQTSAKVAHDPTVCQTQTYLGHKALRRPTYYPSEKAALDIPAKAPSKDRPTSVAEPWSWAVSSLPAPDENLLSLLERLLERSMAPALLEELKTVATEVKKSQIENTVGSLCAALAAEENP